MTILITGATGYLGKHVLKLLKKTSHTCIVVTRTEKTIPKKTTELISVSGNITNKKSLVAIKKAFPSIDAIIHMAALVPKNPTEDKETEMKKANIDGTKNLLDVFGTNVKTVVYASTVEIYGLQEQTKPLDETVIPDPISWYAKTKLAGEKVCEEFSQKTSIPISLLRFSVMYGAGDTIARAVPNFIKAALTQKEIKLHGGEELRDYVHIEDCARAVILALQKKASGVFVIGSGKATSIKESAEVIVKKINPKTFINVLPRQKKRSDLTMDITKAKKILEYQPTYFFPEGLDEEIAWFKKNIS